MAQCWARCLYLCVQSRFSRESTLYPEAPVHEGEHPPLSCWVWDACSCHADTARAWCLVVWSGSVSRCCQVGSFECDQRNQPT